MQLTVIADAEARIVGAAYVGTTADGRFDVGVTPAPGQTLHSVDLALEPRETSDLRAALHGLRIRDGRLVKE